ncbi:MAG: hypothetical protein AUI15_23495 [Actinobacteria bacterium 13_2_20CM_2_66_6]|nr:MAG: hypothetical protein AUI15_23495 [Actinobacteria bacterium 13_2_20CM_2_66_6]
MDLGLAAAIGAAATLVWIQRRRRYVPRTPSPALRLGDPDLTPMPPVVTKVRRGLHRAMRRQPGDAGTDLLLDADQPDTDAQLEELDRDGDPDLDPDGDLKPDDVDEGTGVDAGWPDQADPPPVPDRVPVAPALDHALLQVWPPAGLGLTGPGGEAAARGLLVAALAADGLDEPQARGRVVIPAATLATLLGTEAVQVADTPRLSVTAGLPEALEVLEAATMHRTRLAYDHEVDTVAALRDADPLEEPLPPLLLIADATAIRQRACIASLLTQGQRLDIHGVLLGVWDDGNTAASTRPARRGPPAPRAAGQQGPRRRKGHLCGAGAGRRHYGPGPGGAGGPARGGAAGHTGRRGRRGNPGRAGGLRHPRDRRLRRGRRRRHRRQRGGCG